MNLPNGLEIRIFVEGGQVKVAAPTAVVNGRQGFDQLLCYALLEAGRDAIKDHNDAMRRSPIVPANGRDMLDIQRRAGT